MDSNKLSKEFLAERDSRIFGLKKSGVSNQDIGRRFNMTASAVAAATRRQLGRLMRGCRILRCCVWSWSVWMSCRRLCGL